METRIPKENNHYFYHLMRKLYHVIADRIVIHCLNKYEKKYI